METLFDCSQITKTNKVITRTGSISFYIHEMLYHGRVWLGLFKEIVFFQEQPIGCSKAMPHSESI